MIEAVPIPTPVGVESGLATVTPIGARKPSMKTARRKLEAALRAVEMPNPSIADLRRAQLMACGAGDVLDGVLEVRAASNLEEQRAHARALARTMRDARGRKRAPAPSELHGAGC